MPSITQCENDDHYDFLVELAESEAIHDQEQEELAESEAQYNQEQEMLAEYKAIYNQEQ